MTAFKIRIGFLLVVLTSILIGGATWAWQHAEPSGGLRSSDPAARVAEATALAERRRDDPSADDELIAALSDPSESVRAVAADTLGKRATTKAAKPLTDALKDQASTVRAAAAYSLGKMPELDDSSVKALMVAFEEPTPFVRRSAFQAVEARARAATAPDDPRVRTFEPIVLAAARDSAPQVRLAAAKVLRDPPKGCIVDPDAAVLAEASLLDDADQGVRLTAVNGLPLLLKVTGMTLGEPPLRALAEKVPALVSGVLTGDRDVRPQQQAAISAIGTAARASKFQADEATAAKAREALESALKSPRPEVRMAIVPALPAIAPMLGTDPRFLDESLREALADTYTEEVAVRTIRTALDQDATSDEPSAKRSLDHLRETLKAKSPIARGAAYTALWTSSGAKAIGGDALQSELREATRSWIADLNSAKKAEARHVAAWALSWTDREDADAALAALTAALKDDEPIVQDEAKGSLSILEATKAKAEWPKPSWKPFRRIGRPPM